MTYFKYNNIWLFAVAYLVLSISQSNEIDVKDVHDDTFILTAKVWEYVSETWDIVNKVTKHVDNVEVTPAVWFLNTNEKRILANFGRITNLIETIQRDTDDIRTMMLGNLKKLQSMPNAMLNGIQVNELLECVRSIEYDFRTMEDFKLEGTENEENLNPSFTSYTLEQFANAMLSYLPGAPHKQMAKIHSIIVPEFEEFDFHTHGGVFSLVKYAMEQSDMLCDQNQSLQQLIYDLFKVLHLTQLKGYSVIQFSWMLLQTYGKGNFTYEQMKQTEQFKRKTTEQLSAVQNVLQSTNNMYWKCDPEKHVKDKTYLEVTQLLQGYIENEADMTSKHSCWRNCAYYDVAEHKSCNRDEFCAKQKVCHGRILNCRFFDSDMRICQSPFESNRRYDYISYKKGKVLGDASSNCKGTMSNVDSWWVYLFWHCSYCFCLCDSIDSSSDRHFSLKPSLSDIDKNKVVTGIRFIKVKQMFHLQVQEGDLGPRGLIIESSRRWVEVPGPEFSFKNRTLKEGVDFHTLTYTARALDLDDVYAPNDTVITGVKFRMIGSHLNIEIRVTPFDFMTGKLIDPSTKSNWIGNDNTEFSNPPRVEIDISNSDLPTKSPTLAEMHMSSNKYLFFTHSSIDRDVAQTTLPFIDNQIVAPYPGVPLSGVGIYFKGKKNYAGYIGLSVFTYDLSKNLKPELLFNE